MHLASFFFYFLCLLNWTQRTINRFTYFQKRKASFFTRSCTYMHWWFSGRINVQLIGVPTQLIGVPIWWKKASPPTRSCIGGSVVEFSPATREARVRFPANAGCSLEYVREWFRSLGKKRGSSCTHSPNQSCHCFHYRVLSRGERIPAPWSSKHCDISPCSTFSRKLHTFLTAACCLVFAAVSVV